MIEQGAAEVLPRRAPTGHGYRDELNFAEFPLASVSDTIADNQKTLEFTDEIFDPSTGKTVARTLSITAADKFGLPTALDDEVLLGLMQLSCEQGFAERKVHFSRYELIKLLGWRDESKSYKRIEESLNRWTGVTLQYQKAWWSKEDRCWVNETFHVIDQVTVFDRERIARRRQMAKESPEKALSSFVWNDTVFQSFKAGYIKALDFDFYKSLGSAISKRMFRFLDKRFYHKGRWEFDLRTFACEHIGLSKKYSNSELKRKLSGAIAELEEADYLTRLADSERFVRVQSGQWKAVFVKAATKPSVLRSEAGEADSLVTDLVARGITRRSAQKLLDHHPRAKIQEKVGLYDWMKGRGGEGTIRNRAGWLYSAIANDYEVPAEAVAAIRPAAKPVAQAASRDVIEATTEPLPEESAFDTFWAGLSPSEQADYERDAVAASPAFLQKQYRDGEEGRGTLWRVTRDRALRAHFAATRPA